MGNVTMAKSVQRVRKIAVVVQHVEMLCVNIKAVNRVYHALKIAAAVQ